jgi:hypothetical protein
MEPKAAVVLNGIARFGRDVLWAYVMMERPPFEIVAINMGGLTAQTAAILLEEDRQRMSSDVRVTHTADELVLGDRRFRILTIRKLEEAPWAELGADIIVESVICKHAVPRAHFHLQAGATRVVIYEGGSPGTKLRAEGAATSQVAKAMPHPRIKHSGIVLSCCVSRSVGRPAGQLAGRSGESGVGGAPLERLLIPSEPWVSNPEYIQKIPPPNVFAHSPP